MKRLIALALLFVVSTSASAQTNGPLRLQPDEMYPHSCDMGAQMAAVVSISVTKIGGGTDATPGGCTPSACTAGGLLVGVPALIDGVATSSAVRFRVDPDNGAVNRNGNNYQIHILAEDADGNRYACDGPLSIKAARVSF